MTGSLAFLRRPLAGAALALGVLATAALGGATAGAYTPIEHPSIVAAPAQAAAPKQRVRITLREINVRNDGDLFDDGELLWGVTLRWAGGSIKGCFPAPDNFCRHESRGTGRFVPKNYLGEPLTFIFAEENFDTFPTEITLDVYQDESDAVGQFTIPFPSFGYVGEKVWPVPQAKEWDSTPYVARVTDGKSEADLSFTFEFFRDNLSYPAPRRNMPSSTWARPSHW